MYAPLWFRNWRKNKRDWEELTQIEIRKALRKQELRHTRAMDKSRIDHFNLRIKFEKDIQLELKEAKKQLDIEFQSNIEQYKINYNTKIEGYENTIENLTESVRYAQDFWRDLYKDKDELLNIAIVLSSKAEVNLKMERDELQSVINKKAEDMKQINMCVEKIETVVRRLNKKSEIGEEVIHLLPEDKSV